MHIIACIHLRKMENISWACLGFPFFQDSLASGSISREPWFLWSNATAIRPLAEGVSLILVFQSAIAAFATRIIRFWVPRRG